MVFRTIHILTNFTPEEISILDQASKISGLKRAVLIRLNSLKGAKKILKEEGNP